LFVTNDSGPAHFARAVGRPTVVVHTSTAAARTGAAGSIAIEPVGLACHPCERPTCAIGYLCHDTPVRRVADVVLAELQAAA
jgi:ADP-heptose:LPS heptosyltransferase